MNDYIKKIRTNLGDLQIDYEALANLPQSDTTLTRLGAFADAKVTGDSLNNKAETMVYSGILETSNWSLSAPYSQTIDISGILATDNPIVDVDMSVVNTSSAGKELLEAWQLVGRIVANTNNIIAYCYEERPTVNIPIILKIIR